MPKQVCAFPEHMGYCRKFIRNFAKIAKPLTLLTHQQAHLSERQPIKCFLTLKESVIQAPILHYPNPKKCYIVYTDASDDACGAQLSQEHDGTEFPIAFLSHTFTKEMEHHRTGCLQCLLHSHKMELLPSRNLNHSMELSQSTGKIS